MCNLFAGHDIACGHHLHRHRLRCVPPENTRDPGKQTLFAVEIQDEQIYFGIQLWLTLCIARQRKALPPFFATRRISRVPLEETLTDPRGKSPMYDAPSNSTPKMFVCRMSSINSPPVA